MSILVVRSWQETADLGVPFLHLTTRPGHNPTSLSNSFRSLRVAANSTCREDHMHDPFIASIGSPVHCTISCPLKSGCGCVSHLGNVAHVRRRCNPASHRLMPIRTYCYKPHTDHVLSGPIPVLLMNPSLALPHPPVASSGFSATAPAALIFDSNSFIRIRSPSSLLLK
jgi:hypothetical protein